LARITSRNYDPNHYREVLRILSENSPKLQINKVVIHELLEPVFENWLDSSVIKPVTISRHKDRTSPGRMANAATISSCGTESMEIFFPGSVIHIEFQALYGLLRYFCKWNPSVLTRSMKRVDFGALYARELRLNIWSEQTDTSLKATLNISTDLLDPFDLRGDQMKGFLELGKIWTLLRIWKWVVLAFSSSSTIDPGYHKQLSRRSFHGGMRMQSKLCSASKKLRSPTRSSDVQLGTLNTEARLWSYFYRARIQSIGD
jgi:hypothetical protein